MIDSILDALGYVGDSLDKAGPRPLRGLLAGKPREALSFVPFSDELGLTDPNDIRTGRHVTDNMGLTDAHDTGWGASGMGMLADAVIDPTVLAGTALAGYRAHKGLLNAARSSVSHGGGRLGFNDFFVPGFGKSQAVQNAIDYHGLQYPPEHGQDLIQSLIGGYRKKFPEFARKYEIMSPEERLRLHQEIPPGTKLLGSGVEGPALQTPYDSVIKLGPATSFFNAHEGEASRIRGAMPAVGRPNIPETLRPLRSNVYGGQREGVRVEHLHRVEPLDSIEDLYNKARSIAHSSEDIDANEWPAIANAFVGAKINGREITDALQESIRKNHPTLNPFDVHAGNVSVTPYGRMVIHDSGAIGPRNQENLAEMVRNPAFPTAPVPHGWLEHNLLQAGDPSQQLREALMSAVADPQKVANQGVAWPGAFSGTVDPLTERNTHMKAIKEFIARNQSLLSGHQPAMGLTPQPHLGTTVIKRGSLTNLEHPGSANVTPKLFEAALSPRGATGLMSPREQKELSDFAAALREFAGPRSRSSSQAIDDLLAALGGF